MFKRDELPYRQSTLAAIVNDDGLFLLVNKSSYQEDQWSFPGGGVDDGETPDEAIVREMFEELNSTNFQVVAKSVNKVRYEWPNEVVEQIFTKKGIYMRGQELTQFWVKFLGKSNEVSAGDGTRAIKWVSRDELKTHLIFPNQWESAEKLISEFIN